MCVVARVVVMFVLLMVNRFHFQSVFYAIALSLIVLTCYGNNNTVCTQCCNSVIILLYRFVHKISNK